MKSIRLTRVANVLAAILLTVSGAAAAKDELPDVTSDGLKRIESAKVSALYWADGATLEGYTAVKILECPVAFRKNWQRDHNARTTSLSSRVRDSDMDRIRNGLSELFQKEFAENLKEAGYEVVEETGSHVLLLRPAIINLDVTAPDLREAGMVRNYTASAGSMTLYMEMYDAATGAKIAELLDAEGARDNGFFEYANSVSNTAEARRILDKWATLLVGALDEANGKGKDASD